MQFGHVGILIFFFSALDWGCDVIDWDPALTFPKCWTVTWNYKVNANFAVLPCLFKGFVICSRDEANMEMDSMNWGYSKDEPGHFDFESLEDFESLG